VTDTAKQVVAALGERADLLASALVRVALDSSLAEEVRAA
jgi:hypothetical protein